MLLFFILGNSYATPRFPGNPEIVNYDAMKNLDMEGNDIPYSGEQPCLARAKDYLKGLRVLLEQDKSILTVF